MNKHGVENFILEIIEELPLDSTKEESDIREIFWINELNTIMPFGYNMTRGGDGGNTLEKWDQDKKESLWKEQGNKRRGKRSPEWCKAISDGSFGKKLSEETKKKISDTNKRKGISPPENTKWKKGQIGTFSGKTHNEITKQKISKARIGKTYEDIYGENANVQRNIRKENWTGSKNPNFIEFPLDVKKEILIVLSTNKLYMKDLVEKYKISGYKLKMWFREIGVDNYQSLWYKTSKNEWCEFWRNMNDNS
jgi:hypothetical protein